MSERLSRFAPLTGVIFAALSAVSIAITPGSPSAHASGRTVIAFYEAHHRVERVSTIVSVFALTFLMFFAASLRSHLRQPARLPKGSLHSFFQLQRCSPIGLTTSAGFAYALADAPGSLAPSSAQTLNLLDEDVFFAMVAGIGLFGIAGGLAILRAGQLPGPLAWAAIAIGVVAFTPVFGIALIALTVWVLIASVLTYLRTGRPEAARAGSASGLAALP